MKLKMKDGTGWCLIPPEIVSRQDLTSNEKLIAGRVLGLALKKGYCYATNKWLGEQFGLSGGTVGNLISSLVRKNILRREVIRNEKKEIIQRKLYPLSINEWIPINGKMEEEGRVFSGREKNDNGFSSQKSNKKDTDTILSHLKKNPSDSENVNRAIRYYHDVYCDVVGKPHPRITSLQFEGVKDGFLNPVLSDLHDLDLESLIGVIDSWFSDKNVESDYNIIHFASGEVILQHFIKAYGYIE